MAEPKLKPGVPPQVGQVLLARREALQKELAGLERDCFEPIQPEQMSEMANANGPAAPDVLAALEQCRNALLALGGISSVPIARDAVDAANRALCGKAPAPNDDALRALLQEVRGSCTRDDDLPGDLLSRIDAALGVDPSSRD